MTDREHLLALRADVGVIMVALTGLLRDVSELRGIDGGSVDVRMVADRMNERAGEIIEELIGELKADGQTSPGR